MLRENRDFQELWSERTKACSCGGAADVVGERHPVSSAWEKSWKHKQPLGNESFSSSSSQWPPTHEPCSTQRTQPTLMPSFRTGGPPTSISWDGSREGKPAAPALEFYSLFYFNCFKLIPGLLRPIFPGPLGPLPQGWVSWHKEVGRPCPGDVPGGDGCASLQPHIKPHLPKVPQLMMGRSPGSAGLRPLLGPSTHTEAGPGCSWTDPCSQTSFLHPRYFQVLSCETKWPETFHLEERKKR